MGIEPSVQGVFDTYERRITDLQKQLEAANTEHDLRVQELTVDLDQAIVELDKLLMDLQDARGGEGKGEAEG